MKNQQSFIFNYCESVGNGSMKTAITKGINFNLFSVTPVCPHGILWAIHRGHQAIDSSNRLLEHKCRKIRSVKCGQKRSTRKVNDRQCQRQKILSLNSVWSSSSGMLLQRMPSNAHNSIKLRRHPLMNPMLNGGSESGPAMATPMLSSSTICKNQINKNGNRIWAI